MSLQGRDTTYRRTHVTERKRPNSQPNSWYSKEEKQLIDQRMSLQGRDTTHRLTHVTARKRHNS